MILLKLLPLFLQTEISLCRVYKRAGVDDHYQLPGTLSSKTLSSKQTAHGSKDPISHQQLSTLVSLAGESSSSSHSSSADRMYLAGSSGKSSHLIYTQTTSVEEDGTTVENSTGGFSSLLASTANYVDYHRNASTTEELSRLLVGYSQHNHNMISPHQLHPLPSQPPLLPLNMVPIPDKLWDWNLLPESGREYSGASFK